MSRTWSPVGSDSEGLFLYGASNPGSAHRLRKNGLPSLEELNARGEQLYKAESGNKDDFEIDSVERSSKCNTQTSISEKILEDMPKYSSDSGKSKQETNALNIDPTQAEVEHFYILDEANETACVSRLLFDTETEEPPREYMLRGKADGGLLQVAKRVTSWKAHFDKSPFIFLKDLQGKWIQLGKANKTYERDRARRFFILLNFVNFVKRNLDTSREAVWDHVRKVCSYTEKEPSEDDVLELLHILKKLVAQDSRLSESPIIMNILRKRKAYAEPDSDRRLKTMACSEECSESEDASKKRLKALVDESENEDGSKKRLKAPVDESESEDEDNELGESICAICDDGGELLCCDGPCLRSFHGTPSPESACESLNMTESELEQKFFCKNCAQNIHQCFSCGELGPSTGPPCPQKVHLCQVALCGKFYHLSCVSKLIGDEASGKEGFSCPLHICHECHQSEREEENLWLYECRRCPRSWHRKCADKRIKFKDGEGQRRAWKVAKTRFLYCMLHEIDQDLGTPERNHLKFPSEVTSVEHSEVQNLSPDKNIPSTNEVIDQRKEKESTTHAERKLTKAEITDPVIAIMKESVRYITPAKVASELRTPVTFSSTPFGKFPVNKMHSLLRAYRKACEHLRAGRNEEARRILPPRMFHYSKESLRAYLSPFMQGTKDTPYGRYFTSDNKLQVVVDRLCWYVNSGDMVADLCCGANTFSRLMSRQLKLMGKQCFFKNYDIIQPSDTFNFESRDYMTIRKDEIHSGSKLIMGLHPPSGVMGQTASAFAARCATYQPKLIILIAPKETERLEPYGYELLWEDKELLKGDAFYLPGTVDTEGNTIVYENKNPPHLFLWSRADFSYHKEIAKERGHIKALRAHCASLCI